MKKIRGLYPDGLMKEIGTAGDAELGRKYGYSREFIRQLRQKANIPKFVSLMRDIEIATKAEIMPRYLPVEKRLYSVTEASQYLGLSRQTLMTLLKNGEFEIIKITPGKFLIDKKDLDSWIQKQKRAI